MILFVVMALMAASIFSWGSMLLLYRFADKRKNARLKNATSAFIQICVFSSLLCLLFLSNGWGVFFVASGPFSLTILVDLFEGAQFANLWRAFWPLALTGFTVTLLTLSKLPGFAHRLALIVSLFVGSVAGYLPANNLSAKTIEQEAQRLGATCLATGTLYRSIVLYFDRWPTRVHASAIINGKRMGWSFKEKSFYPDIRYPESQPTDLGESCHSIGLKPRDI